MLVQLRQYKHGELQFDDNRTTGQSQTEDTVNPDSENYFGKDFDEFDVETWERVEYEGDPDLPGRTHQVRTQGDVESFPQTELIEVQDQTP